MCESPTAWKLSTLGAPASSVNRRIRLSNPPIGRTSPIASRSSPPNHSSGPGRFRQAWSKVSGSDRMRRSSRSPEPIARVAETIRPSVGTIRNFEIAEVASELRRRRRGHRLVEPVPTGQVHQSALADGLGDRHPDPGRPGRHVATPPGRRDDQIGRELGPVLEDDAGHHRGRRRRWTPASSPRTGAALRSSTPGSSAAARRRIHSNVLRRTSKMARSSSPGWGSPSAAVPDMVVQPGRVQRVEHVGEPLTHEHHDLGQEPVGLVDLRGAGALVGEGGLHRGRLRRRVSLEHDDLAPAAGQRQGGAQSPDSAPDHDDALRCHRPPSEAPLPAPRLR